MFKKLLILIISIVIFIPNLKADMYVNFNNARAFANSYITKFNDYDIYIVTNPSDNKFEFNSNAFVTNTNFKVGGFLNVKEFEIIGSANSYLYDGQGYWTMTSSGSSYYAIDAENANKLKLLATSETTGARITQFVKPAVEVTGSGTRANPWEFVPIQKSYQITIRVQKKGDGIYSSDDYVIKYDEEYLTKEIYADLNRDLTDAKIECEKSASSITPSSDGRSATVKITNAQSNDICTVTTKPRTFTVTFNANKGQVDPKSKQVTIDTAFGDLPIPTYSCNIFHGWYTSDDEKITEDTIYTDVYDMTLNAKWENDPELGEWGECTAFTSLTGNYANGTETNTCGATRACTKECTFSHTRYSNGTCGNIYNVYSCGYEQYAGFKSCLTPPVCTVHFEPTYVPCNTSTRTSIYATCNPAATSASWYGQYYDLDAVLLNGGTYIDTTGKFLLNASCSNSGTYYITLTACNSEGCTNATGYQVLGDY